MMASRGDTALAVSVCGAEAVVIGTARTTVVLPVMDVAFALVMVTI
jgi:hypothetical protein